jgi:hypothetical protein
MDNKKMNEAKKAELTESPKFWLVVIAITIFLGLVHFEILNIPLYGEEKLMPIYMSGEPADIPAIEENLGIVAAAGCSGSEAGTEIVGKALLSILRGQADELGADAIIDTTFAYVPHADVSTACAFPVSTSGMAVEFDD